MILSAGINIFKLIQILIISGIKFLFAPFLSVGYGFNYFQTILITSAGGILGILFFYHLSKWLIRQYNKFCPVVYSYFSGKGIEESKRVLNCGSQRRKVFSPGNRKLVEVKNKYGYLGIIIFTPVLLSIPLGAFLARRYYSKRKSILLYMSLSITIWSFFISTVYFLF